MSAHELGQTLVSLCSQGQFMDVIANHYADDCVSVESMDMGGQGREAHGLDAIKAKNEWWAANHEVHGLKVEGPFSHGDDKFGVIFEIDVTPKQGPTAGTRQTMRELGIYTTRDGKVAREEFYYGQ